jgi:hypothetical protein
VTILRTRLEQQLITALSNNLLDSRLEEKRTREFAAQLKARIELEEKLAREAEVNRPALEKERSELNSRGRRLGEAIATLGLSAFVAEQLGIVESRLVEIDRLLTSKPAAKLPSFTNEQIREFLPKECKTFCEVLVGDPELAKQEIQKRIKKLVLTPKQTADGTVLDVTGDVELLQAQGGVMLNSSMEGTAQQYISTPIALANMVLDPSLPITA